MKGLSASTGTYKYNVSFTKYDEINNNVDLFYKALKLRARLVSLKSTGTGT